MLYVAVRYASVAVSMAMRSIINCKCNKSKLFIFRGVNRGRSTRSASLVWLISCTCRDMQRGVYGAKLRHIA